VALSDGTTGIVIRPTQSMSQPIVRVLGADETLLNLTTSNLTITESMLSEDRDHVRIPRRLLSSILWPHPDVLLGLLDSPNS
jgi:hypothetical protein